MLFEEELDKAMHISVVLQCIDQLNNLRKIDSKNLLLNKN